MVKMMSFPSWGVISRQTGSISCSITQASKEAEKSKQRQEKELAKTGFGGKKALNSAASIMHVGLPLHAVKNSPPL